MIDEKCQTVNWISCKLSFEQLAFQLVLILTHYMVYLHFDVFYSCCISSQCMYMIIKHGLIVDVTEPPGACKAW